MKNTSDATIDVATCDITCICIYTNTTNLVFLCSCSKF